MLDRVIRRLRSDEGGYAFIMVLAFMAFAVPMTVASLQLASQLTVNAQRHQDRLTSSYSGGGALEVALLEIRSNPNNPGDFSLELNGGTTNVTIQAGTSTSDLSDYYFADVVIALDISGSSNEEQQQLKDAANEIVDGFDLYNNSSRFHVGVTRFRGSSASQVAMTNVDVQIGTPIADHWTGVAIHDGISNMNGAGLVNGVDIVAAIDGGAAQFATGLGERLATPNLMVLILDDDDTEGNTDIAIANAEAASGAEIFVVGVGAIASTTLDAIASEPNSTHQWYSSDYSGLLSLVDSIAQSVRDAGLFGNIYDIEITDPNGNVTRCRALLTPDDSLVVISCE